MTSTSAFSKYQSRMRDAVQLILDEDNLEIEIEGYVGESMF
jgi:hypothetical protein